MQTSKPTKKTPAHLFTILLTAVLLLTTIALLTLAKPQSAVASDTLLPTFNLSDATWSDGSTHADNNCAWDGTVLTLADTANIAVTGTVTDGRRIAIAQDAAASLTLNDVSVTGLSNSSQSPLLLNDGATLTLTLAGESTLTGANNGTGIFMASTATLTVKGDGIMNIAVGGTDGVGIGDRNWQGGNGGTVIIDGGTVNITAPLGIGCQNESSIPGSTLTINGGTVTVIAQRGIITSSGITVNGGTLDIKNSSIGMASNGDIIINDGTVSAGGTSYGAAIVGHADSDIIIKGGVITATNGGTYGVGIGASNNNNESNKIIIEGGFITATGSGTYGVGIGGGDNSEVIISGGTVVATGVSAGIGTTDNRSGATLTLNGNALVFTNSVSDMSDGNKTGGILVIDGTTHFYGGDNLTVDYNAFIPENQRLILPRGKTLTVDGGYTLTNQGILYAFADRVSGHTANNPITVPINQIDLSSDNPYPYGIGWDYENNIYTVLDTASVSVSGTSANNRRLEVAQNATANITLDGVSITGLDNNQSALRLNSGVDLTLTLVGESTLTGGTSAPGIFVANTAKLTIKGDGTINATAGNGTGVAGIGGGSSSDNGGTVVIDGGTVNATGSTGIGGYGITIPGGSVTINGGTVTASGTNSNAIATSSGITINGGTVTATGSNGMVSYGDITINGGTVNASGGFGAGIRGHADSDIIIKGGTVTATGVSNGTTGIGGVQGDSSGSKVVIEGGTVTATGNGADSVGIGGGSNGEVVISGGFVVATGNLAGIGNHSGGSGGTLEIKGNAAVFANSVSDMSDGNKTSGILVVGNTTHWYGDDLTIDYDFEVGSGRQLVVPRGKTLTMANGATLTNNGVVYAFADKVVGNVVGNAVTVPADNQIDLSTASPHPYGDGWDYANNVYTILDGADVIVTGTSSSFSRRLEVEENATAKVTFDGVAMVCSSSPFTLNNNAEVTLTLVGSNTLATDYSSYAGIQMAATAALTVGGKGSLIAAGGNFDGSGINGGSITINSGTVIAVGGGDVGTGIDSTLSMHGNALVFANSVSDMAATNRTGGALVVNNNQTHFYGGVLIIDYDAVIPMGRTLTVPLGKTLVVAEGGSLTVNGTLNVEGEVSTQVAATANSGVTAPVAKETPNTSITNGENFTATLTWNNNPETFDYATAYTATITLTADEGYTFFGFGDTASIAGFTVNGIAPVFVSNDGTTLVFTVTFPTTAKQPITAAAIGGITSPVANAIPSTDITNGTGFAAVITWNGSPATFDYDTAYTATITLTATEGFIFEGFDSTAGIAGFTVNGIAPIFVSNDGTTLIFTITFPKTAEQPDEGLPAWAIALIVIGGVLILAGGGIATVFILKKKKSAAK